MFCYAAQDLAHDVWLQATRLLCQHECPEYGILSRKNNYNVHQIVRSPHPYKVSDYSIKEHSTMGTHQEFGEKIVLTLIKLMFLAM